MSPVEPDTLTTPTERVRARVHPAHADQRDDIRSTHAVRLGLRQIKGIKEEDAGALMKARGAGFDSVRDLWLRSGLSRAAIERLADADAFRSIGLDRRDALWAARGLGSTAAADRPGGRLPLFDVAEHGALQREPDVTLPPMPIGEHVVNDYRFLSLSLKAHPVSFLRHDLAARRVISNATLIDLALKDEAARKARGEEGRRPDREEERPRGAEGRSPDREGSRGAEGRSPDREGSRGAEGRSPDREGPRGEERRRRDREEKSLRGAEGRSPDREGSRGVEERSLDAARLPVWGRAKPAVKRHKPDRDGPNITRRPWSGPPPGRRVTVSGLVLVRQRPGTASGVIFMTIEDETDIANIIVWPRTFERFRPVVLGARLVAVTGRVQSESGVIHVVAERLEDLTPMLAALSEEAADPRSGETVKALSRADEVRRPQFDMREKIGPRARSVRLAKEVAGKADAEAAGKVMPKGRNFH